MNANLLLPATRTVKHSMLLGAVCMLLVCAWFYLTGMPMIKIFKEISMCASSPGPGCHIIHVHAWKNIVFNFCLYISFGLLWGLLIERFHSPGIKKFSLLVILPILFLASFVPLTLHYLDYQNFSSINKYPQLCSLFSTIKEQNRCYYETARNLKNPESCSYMKSETKRDECFDIFSRAEKNKESCLFIKNIEQKNSCQEDVEWLQKNS